MEESELGQKMLKYSLILQKPNVTEEERNKIKERCFKYLARVNQNLEELVSMFNELVLDIARMLCRLFPTKMNKVYLTMLETKVKGDDKAAPLTGFMTSVYANDEYRTRLISGDEEFFMNMDIEDEPKIIRKLKECWSQLSSSHKENVFGTVRTLVNIVEKYVEFKDDGNKILPVLAKA